MNWGSRDEALRDYFADEWTATAISYEFWGEMFEPQVGVAHIRPEVIGEASGQVAKAGTANFYRFLATLRIRLRFPAGIKTSTANGVLDALALLFRSQTIASVGRFRVPTVSAPIREGAWVEYHMHVDFYRDLHEAQP